jgi:hypothetical protein
MGHQQHATSQTAANGGCDEWRKKGHILACETYCLSSIKRAINTVDPIKLMM